LGVVVRSLVAFAAFLAVVWLVVWGWSRVPSYAPLTPAERDAVMARLRERDRPLPDSTPDHILDRPLGGPLFVSVYDKGAPVAARTLVAPTLAAALAEAAADPSLRATPEQRYKVDVMMARAHLATAPAPLFALSLVPGVDGIGVTVDGRTAYLLPDELMRGELLTAWLPVSLLDFELGADVDGIAQKLARKLGLSDDAFSQAEKRWFRFRVDGFVEPADPARRATTPALPVLRGKVPGPRLSREALRRGAIAGGRYLLRHLYEDGRFGYEYWPGRDEDLPFGLDYSLPRHAGGVYFLAQLYGATHDEQFREGAARSLAFLEKQHHANCERSDRACISDPALGSSDLGGTAMALLATVEYEAASGDRSREDWARRLGNFILFMQKPDGDFCHLYSPSQDARNTKTKMLYFSGEATLALAELVAILDPHDGDRPRYVAALDLALHYLTETQYAHFAGQFFFGEDHWTCIAADAAWDALPPAHREKYARFCDDFAAFLRRGQFTPDESITRAQPDFVGGYSFSPILPPYGTPVGSRTETTLSAYHMQQRRGLADSRMGRATRRQLELGLQFLLDDQVSDDDAYLMANPDAARGGFLMSAAKRYIRIDFIQHNCSAMLRATGIM
jgi:hypothetical protein